VIAFEAIRRLPVGGRLVSIPLGIAVMGFSLVANVVVSTVIARRAMATGSPALEADAAHLRTVALTSGAVLVGLVLVKVTGAQWVDSAVALGVDSVILVTGIRVLTGASQVLVDTSLPRTELDEIRQVVEAFVPRGVVGYHAYASGGRPPLRRPPSSVPGRNVTRGRPPHGHEVQEEIADRLPRADVLPQNRLIPAAIATAKVTMA
jgi:divalent metal cation (Fe/Co/Zn/Cd) transporter